MVQKCQNVGQPWILGEVFYLKIDRHISWKEIYSSPNVILIGHSERREYVSGMIPIFTDLPLFIPLDVFTFLCFLSVVATTSPGRRDTKLKGVNIRASLIDASLLQCFSPLSIVCWGLFSVGGRSRRQCCNHKQAFCLPLLLSPGMSAVLYNENLNHLYAHMATVYLLLALRTQWGFDAFRKRDQHWESLISKLDEMKIEAQNASLYI